MVGDEGHQCLAALPIEILEVAFKVCWQLHLIIVSKMLVQGAEDGVQGVVLFNVGHGEVLKEFPCRTCERPEDIDDRLDWSFGDRHFVVIQGDTFPPFFVIGGLSAECGNVGIP